MLFHLNKTCNLVMPKIVYKNDKISYTSEVKFLELISHSKMEHPHSVFMFKVKQVILYDLVADR